jgi:non-heme chloroperoxidase
VESVTAKYTTGAVELPNGVHMPYLEHGEPAGRSVLFVHAVGDSGRLFETLLSHLPESIHALAPTLRGHGDASRPESGYRSTDSAGDLAAFTNALRIQEAVVVGASSGGQVALRMALDYPGSVLGLVLLGSPLRLGDKPRLREAWDSTFSKLTDPIDPQFVRDFVDSVVVQPLPEAVRESLVNESLKAPAFVWRETMARLLEDDVSAELGRVAAPTLVAWGERDTVLPRDEQKALVSGIPRARLLVYDGGGHAFYLEDPARVAADLVAFVEALDAR